MLKILEIGQVYNHPVCQTSHWYISGKITCLTKIYSSKKCPHSLTKLTCNIFRWCIPYMSNLYLQKAVWVFFGTPQVSAYATYNLDHIWWIKSLIRIYKSSHSCVNFVNLYHFSFCPFHFFLFLPTRESRVQSEAQVPKVILAGRCSKSSAVTGTVVIRAKERQRARVELAYTGQMTWKKKDLENTKQVTYISQKMFNINSYTLPCWDAQLEYLSDMR